MPFLPFVQVLFYKQALNKSFWGKGIVPAAVVSADKYIFDSTSIVIELEKRKHKW